MENSKKKAKYAAKSELKEPLSYLKFQTYSMEEDLQLLDKIGQDYKNYLKTLPSFSRLGRIMRTTLTKYLEKSRFTSSNLSLELGIFVDENVKQTKKSFRSAFRNSPQKHILLSGSEVITTRVYKNTLIQSFFEFSLKYSYILRKPFSVKQLRTIFINFNKVAIGLPIQIKDKKIIEEIQYYQRFVDHIDTGVGFIDLSNLPTGKDGRPKGNKTEHTKTIERLYRQRNDSRKIVEILYPNRSPEDKIQLKESVDKAIQRLNNADKN